MGMIVRIRFVIGAGGACLNRWDFASSRLDTDCSGVSSAGKC